MSQEVLCRLMQIVHFVLGVGGAACSLTWQVVLPGNIVICSILPVQHNPADNSNTVLLENNSYKSQWTVVCLRLGQTIDNPQQTSNNNLQTSCWFHFKFWKALKASTAGFCFISQLHSATTLSSSQTTWLVVSETIISEEEDPLDMVPLRILWHLLPPLWSRWLS